MLYEYQTPAYIMLFGTRVHMNVLVCHAPLQSNVYT